MYSRRLRNDENINTVNKMPSPPPNYRGVLYGAEGDLSDNGAAIRECLLAEENNGGVLIDSNAESKSEREEKSKQNGLHRLISGLSDKSFMPDDVLVCAMILLMLNSNDSDDVLLILVLLMLL